MCAIRTDNMQSYAAGIIKTRVMQIAELIGYEAGPAELNIKEDDSDGKSTLCKASTKG